MRRHRWILGALLAMPAAAVGEHSPHVHGEARLELLQDGARVSVRLEAPGESLLGFEHAARTARELSTVATLRDNLSAPLWWLAPAPANACEADPATPATFTVAGGDQDRDHDHHGGDTHTEVIVEVTLNCADPSQLQAMEVKLFSAFPALQRIRASLLLSTRQDFIELTPASARISLTP